MLEVKVGGGWVLSTLALDRISGGMTLSGPNDCRGSTKEARILAAFLHSPKIC